MTDTKDLRNLKILETYGPKFWAKNIPVMPLMMLDKVPMHKGWTKWCTSMPTPEEQALWVTQYPNNNMGLPCGPQSNLVMLDYDYDNPKVEEAIKSVLPKSPWIRIGRRGYVMAYRYNNTASKFIYDANGKVVVEILSTGRQVVLPPSIHPKTMKPYSENVSLLDVLDDVPLFPENGYDLLRAAIGQVIPLRTKSAEGAKYKFVEQVPSGARDIKMNQAAGVFAHSVLRGEMSIKRALNDMQGWFDMNVERVEGDTLDVNKGKSQIIQYIIRDVHSKNKVLPKGWDDDLTDEEKERWGLKFDDSQKEWSFDEIIKYINKIHESFPADSEEITKMENLILQKIVLSQSMTAVQEDKILNTLRGSGKARVAAYKKQLKQLRSGPVEGISHAEIATAIIEEIKDKHEHIAYWNGEIWVWSGAHWSPIMDQEVRSIIQRDYGSLDLSKRYSDHQGILKVMKDLVPQTIKPPVPIHGVNFANGFLNRDMNLLPHSAEFGMTYTLPFSYRPEMAGKCPMFMEFLRDSWGHNIDFEDKKKALQEAMCTTLFNCAPQYQMAILLYGQAGSGKSVLIQILSAMMSSDSYCAASPSSWGEKYIPHQFIGKLLNIAGELHETKMIDSQVFKQVVSGDEMTVEGKYKDPIKFKPTLAHWFASNYLPKSKDTTNGFNRRWLFLEFDKPVPPSEVDVELGNRIIFEEIEAIVAWALEAWPDLRERNTYTLPLSHYKVLQDMSLQNSNIRDWMLHRIEFKENGIADEADMYKDYFAFTCARGGRAVMAKIFSTEFNNFLKEVGKRPALYQDGKYLHVGMEIKK